MKQRDLGIDLLRAVGLLCIILAHVNPPELLWQLRSFDVVMMVCISTISFTEYSKPQPYFQYIKGRIKRLLFPTWQYIILMGIVFYVISLITGTKTPFPLKTILIGLVTFHGIGYLWVIRVFLYNAFLNPLIKRCEKVSWGGVICIIIGSYAIYELVKYMVMSKGTPMIQTAAEATILDFMAYGIIAVCSFLLYHFTDKKLLTSIGALAAGVISLSLYNHAFDPNGVKYPPGLLYICWGLFVVALSYFILRKVKITKLPGIIKFISANSLWIYFWHAMLLVFERNYYSINNWAVNWFVVVLFSLGMCYLQNKINDFIKSRIAKTNQVTK